MEEAVLPQGTMYTKSPQKSKKIAFFLIVIGLLLLISFALYKTKFAKKQVVPKPTPSPTEYQFPSDTPSPSSITPSISASATPTPKPTIKASSIDTSSGLQRSNLSVSVENGSGVVGAGSKAADVLKNVGYKVISIGNADNFNYQNVTIQVKSSQSSYLSLLQKDLSTDYTIGQTSSDLSASSSADAVIIIGK